MKFRKISAYLISTNLSFIVLIKQLVTATTVQDKSQLELLTHLSRERTVGVIIGGTLWLMAALIIYETKN